MSFNFSTDFSITKAQQQLNAARLWAEKSSAEQRCTKFVNFDVRQQRCYVSDWYDSNSTVARFDNGQEREVD